MPTSSTTLSANTPAFQPVTADPTNPGVGYENQAILWWKNGIWGDAGYAIPNDGGKPRSGNETIRAIVDFIGAELFNLMHQPDVKFSRPFNADWLFALNKMLTLGIKRMSDKAVGWTDTRAGDADHAVNTPQAFRVWPVPYFGGRIRQPDARAWCGQVLILLGECMQHSDNDYDDDITDAFAAKVQLALLRIQGDMAMKYLGMTREATETRPLVIAPDAFSDGKYNPEALFTSRELIEERMPDLWWPTTNDLTPICGIAAPVAKIWAASWPESGDFGDGGAAEAAFPGGGVGVVPEPGARP